MSIIAFRSKRKGGTSNLHIPVWNRKTANLLSLHHQHGPRTWMCDHFFIKANGDVIQALAGGSPNEGETPGTFCILAFLHVNSRIFHAYIVPNKGLEHFVDKIQYYIIPHYPYETYYPEWIRNHSLSLMNTLLCDAAFNKPGVKQWLAERGVNMISRNIARTRDHAFLSPIDRMARTLRDMLFNAKRQNAASSGLSSANPSLTFNEETLKELCKIYNSSPHETLSKTMGFAVCPNDVFWNLDLQDELQRRIYLMNYKTSTSQGFQSVKVGSLVYLHKPREFGKKRRLNVEDTPYIVISLTPLTIENVITHEKRTAHRSDLVLST